MYIYTLMEKKYVHFLFHIFILLYLTCLHLDFAVFRRLLTESQDFSTSDNKAFLNP